MVSKKDMQRTAPVDCQMKIYEELKELEEQRTKEALVPVQKAQVDEDGRRKRKGNNHAKTGGDKYNESMIWRPGMFVVRILFLVFLPSNTDEAMSVSSKMAKEVGKAISEESWTALAKEKKETGGA